MHWHRVVFTKEASEIPVSSCRRGSSDDWTAARDTLRFKCPYLVGQKSHLNGGYFIKSWWLIEIKLQSFFLLSIYAMYVVISIYILGSVQVNLYFFLLSTIFYFFLHTQHNIQNKTKQNSRHILNISRFNQKGGREGRTPRTQKSLHIITYNKKNCQASMVEGLAPPTRAVVHSHETICRRLRIRAARLWQKS